MIFSKLQYEDHTGHGHKGVHLPCCHFPQTTPINTINFIFIIKNKIKDFLSKKNLILENIEPANPSNKTLNWSGLRSKG